MTTKILIVNHGPDHVLVRGYAKDNEPGDNSMGFTSAEFVAPHMSREFYVHGNLGLMLDEDKLGKFAPSAPTAHKAEE